MMAAQRSWRPLRHPQKMLPPFVQRVNATVDIVSTHYYGSCNQRDTDQSVFDAIAQFTDHVRYIYAQLQTLLPNFTFGNIRNLITLGTGY